MNAKYIKPIQLADKLEIRPQQVFGWTKNGNLPYTESDSGTQLVLIADVKKFLGAKAEYHQEKADKYNELVESL